MSPVSFELLGDARDRDALMAQARALREAGVRIHSVDEQRGILVRSDEAVRAKAILSAADRGPAPPPTSSRAIEPLRQPIDADVDIPGSKSHTNRALLCAGLARGRSRLQRVLFADDTRAMMGALSALGVGLETDADAATVDIDGGFDPDLRARTGEQPMTVGVNQSGTTGRFLLPVLAASTGSFVLDGHPQLRARPFGPQIEALGGLGARIEGDRLPLTIAGRSLLGGRVEVAADVSSQFLSGLLLAAPQFERETTVAVEGPMVSRPYVDLTVSTMADFGVDVVSAVDDRGRAVFVVPATGYHPADLALEPDASGASYFFAAAAITGGRVRVDGLGGSTVQGDLGFVEVLARMGAEVDVGPTWTEVRGTGVLRGIEVDMSDISDTAQTLAVVATFADGPTTISGVGFIRHKEIDRIAVPVDELRRLGIEAEATDDGMVIHPGTPRAGRVGTHDDHRMAMSFALLGLVHPGIEIENPGCVAKTFPDFFDRLDRLR